MSTSEQDTMSQHHDSLWETVSKVVDELQNSFYRNSSQLNSSSELVQKLLEIKELPCLIPKEELSIVYCEYGTQNYELIVYAGQVVDGSPPTGAFNPKNQNIKNVAEKSLEQQDYPWFQTKDKCKEAGFGGFGTVMIVPMRLGRDRRLGAFIIHSTQENAYGEPLQRVLDVLSDRLASLIRSLRRELRDRVAYDLRNHLLEQLTSRKPDNVFNKECEVLDAVLSRLREWFKDKNERIYILIHNPLDEKTYHQATNQQGREIQSDFRSLPVLAHQELLQIVGGEENLSKLTTLNNALHGIRVDDASQLPSIREGCQSLLGVTMHYPNGDVLGHVVLHDTGMTHAYDHDDLRFMDAMADFLGLVLAEFRTKQKEKAIHAIESHPAEDTTELHAIVADYLHRLYGIRSFQIWAIETSSQRWEPWAAGLGNGLSLGEDEQFQNAVARFANDYRKWEGYTNKSLKFSWKGANYLVTPMRAGNQTEDWRVIGAFIIPSNNPGSIASNKIDEVSDALGKRLKSQHNQQRYKALTEFVNTVSSLASSNLTQEQVLRIAYEHIQQVMFSANVYIALYDETENSISFPLIYRHGKVWEEMHNATRKIDPTQLGRTEVIIRDKQPLLIKTLEESKAWYKTPGHKDHAGNPLASWVGVPIFSASEGKEKKVRGVIAAYHDGLDYVYSIRDVFFLQNVAGTVSGLFRILDLKEAKRKLEEAQADIADQQEFISSFLERNWLKDITTKTFVDLVAIFKRLDFLSKELQRYNSPNIIEKLFSTVKHGHEKIDNYKDLIEPGKTKSTEIFIPAIINELLYSIKKPDNLEIRHEYTFIEPYKLKIRTDEKSFMQGIFIILSCLMNKIECQDVQKSLIIDYGFPTENSVLINIFSEAFQYIDIDDFCISRAEHVLQKRSNANMRYRQEDNTVNISLYNNQPIMKAMMLVQDDLWRDMLTDLAQNNKLKCIHKNGFLTKDDLEGFNLLIMDESSYRLSSEMLNEENDNIVLAIILDNQRNTGLYPKHVKKIYKDDAHILSDDGFGEFLNKWGLRYA